VRDYLVWGSGVLGFWGSEVLGFSGPFHLSCATFRGGIVDQADAAVAKTPRELPGLRTSAGRPAKLPVCLRVIDFIRTAALIVGSRASVVRRGSRRFVGAHIVFTVAALVGLVPGAGVAIAQRDGAQAARPAQRQPPRDFNMPGAPAPPPPVAPDVIMRGGIRRVVVRATRLAVPLSPSTAASTSRSTARCSRSATSTRRCRTKARCRRSGQLERPFTVSPGVSIQPGGRRPLPLFWFRVIRVTCGSTHPSINPHPRSRGAGHRSRTTTPAPPAWRLR
jgi:hypothetical protein